MKASGRGGPADDREQREVVELVPKPELDRAQRQIERLQKENERRKRESERLKRESERLKQESDRLRQEVERVRKELEAALRASKRQAAPHSRGELKANPTPPGRKPGRAYGRRACRPIPPRLDERIDVALPKHCPRCGGGVELERRAPQYPEEIVRRTVVRRFDIAVGRCRRCGRRVQGRHPLQTSDAVGVGSVQLGPEALTLAAVLNKQMGRSLGHTRQALVYGFGLQASRGKPALARAGGTLSLPGMPRAVRGELALLGAESRAGTGLPAVARQMKPRDAWIGWSDEQRQRHLQGIVNNGRFLILPWVRVKGLASKILALSARRMPRDWQTRYGHRPLLLETLVDAQRFRGICYRATNWIYVGQTAGRGRMDREP